MSEERNPSGAAKSASQAWSRSPFAASEDRDPGRDPDKRNTDQEGSPFAVSEDRNPHMREAEIHDRSWRSPFRRRFRSSFPRVITRPRHAEQSAGYRDITSVHGELMY